MKELRRSSLGRASVRVIAATGLVAATGVLRDVLIAARFGVGFETDAYALVFGGVGALAAAASASVVLLGVPRLSALRARLGVLRPGAVVGRFGGTLLFGTVASAAVLGLAIVNPGLPFLRELDPFQRRLAERLGQVAATLPLAMVLGTLLASAVRVHGRHGVASLAPALRNLGAIAGLVVSASVVGVGAGLAAGLLVEVGVLAGWLWSRAARSETAVGGAPEETSAAWPAWVVPLLPPLMLLTDKVVASSGAPGGPAALEFAYRLFAMPHTLLAMSVVTVAHVEISHASTAVHASAGAGRATGLQSSAAAFVALTIAMTASTLYLFVAAPHVVRLVYGHGAVTTADVGTMTTCLRTYVLGLVPLAWGALAARLCFLEGVAPRMALLALVVAGLNAALDVVVFRRRGLEGIPLVTSLMAWVWAVGLMSLTGVRDATFAFLQRLRRDRGPIAQAVGTMTIPALAAYIVLSRWPRTEASSSLVVSASVLAGLLAAVAWWKRLPARTRDASASAGAVRVVALCEGDDGHASVEHRIRMPFERLAYRGTTLHRVAGRRRRLGRSVVWWVGPRCLLRAWRATATADVLVVHRTSHLGVAILCWLVRRHRGIPVVFDFDDALYVRWRGDWRHPLYAALPWVLRACDAAWCGSHALLDFARRYTEAIWMPTPVAPAFLAVTRRNVSPPCIVWLGNGPIHLESLRLLVAPLERLARVSRYRLRILSALGSEEVRATFAPIVSKVEVQWGWETWQPVERLASALEDADIGVMPLADTAWNEGKCAIKALECMAAGLAVVCSPVGENRVVAGEGGVHACLAKDEREWYRTLRALVTCPRLGEHYGRVGRDRVRESYDVDAVAARMDASLRALTGRGVAPAAQSDS